LSCSGTVLSHAELHPIRLLCLTFLNFGSFLLRCSLPLVSSILDRSKYPIQTSRTASQCANATSSPSSISELRRCCFSCPQPSHNLRYLQLPFALFYISFPIPSAPPFPSVLPPFDLSGLICAEPLPPLLRNLALFCFTLRLLYRFPHCALSSQKQTSASPSLYPTDPIPTLWPIDPALAFVARAAPTTPPLPVMTITSIITIRYKSSNSPTPSSLLRTGGAGTGTGVGMVPVPTATVFRGGAVAVGMSGKMGSTWGVLGALGTG
jgi:hypothetical protein